MIYFNSDYMAGAHPEIMERLLETNLEKSVGYGLDEHSERAKELIKRACEMGSARVYFLVGGTQTNSTVIDGILARHEGVLAAESGHISVHEAGAVEASGHKVLTLPHHEGKVLSEDVDNYIEQFYRDETYEHMVAPGMLYISQPTEYGTIYSRRELEELHKVCHKHNIPLFIDGARLGYALAAKECDMTLKDLARLCDVFYIGGTKMGALFGEAVVVTNPNLLSHFFPLIKQHGALLAKGRLLGVQFEKFFEDGLYMRIGEHAVGLALQLREAMEQRGYKAIVNSTTNQQFFTLPNTLIDRLKPHVGFELWGARGEEESAVRFVTSWSTTKEDVDQLIALL